MSALLEVFGTRCLEVLSDEATLAILLHLGREASSPSQIEASIDGIGYRVALARLRLLRSRGLVEHSWPARTVIGGGAFLIG